MLNNWEFIRRILFSRLRQQQLQDVMEEKTWNTALALFFSIFLLCVCVFVFVNYPIQMIVLTKSQLKQTSEAPFMRLLKN